MVACWCYLAHAPDGESHPRKSIELSCGRLRPLQPIVLKTRRSGVIVVAGYCTFKNVSFVGSLEFRGGLQVDSYIDLDIVNRNASEVNGIAWVAVN
jgi:hypothetical protein